MLVQLLAHLRRYLGDTDREVLGGTPVAVRSWPDPEGEPGVRVLATLGMSLLSQATPPPGGCVAPAPQTELLCLAPAEHELSLAHLLSDLSQYPSRESTWLHWYHNISLGLPLLPCSELTAVFTDVPFLGPDFATACIHGSRIDILWVIPITTTEQSYLRANGFDAFSELFADADPDLTDLFRTSIVNASGA